MTTSSRHRLSCCSSVQAAIERCQTWVQPLLLLDSARVALAATGDLATAALLAVLGVLQGDALLLAGDASSLGHCSGRTTSGVGLKHWVIYALT